MSTNQTHREYKILFFDPGVTVTGWAGASYSPATSILNVIRYGTIKPSKVAAKRKEEIERYGTHIITFDELQKATDELVAWFKPDIIGCESAFYNPRRPNAYASLSLCIHTIRCLLFNKYQKNLVTIAPRSIKLSLTGTGLSDKDQIQHNVVNHPNIVFKSTRQWDVEKMVEHEGDAIAGCYAVVVQNTNLEALI